MKIFKLDIYPTKQEIRDNPKLKKKIRDYKKLFEKDKIKKNKQIRG